MKFLTQAVYDVLPSPSNLFCWGKVEPACPLCLQRGTLEHILGRCSRGLGEWRYHWRHDHVLKAIADTICSAISHCKRPMKKTIAFVRAGEKPTPVVRATSSDLPSAAQD